jgi:D-alanyl-D-alanine carboxypeptidase (penicillin-binding protein 5/6)
MQVDLPPGTAPPPAQRATAWIVVDLADGSVLASCNAHVPLAPASTLKVLTALTLYHRIPSGPRYRATDADARVDGTRVGLVPRSVYRVRDLWHGLLLGSGNDAAQALASLAGGMPAAARLMTERARQLGAADTVARNTSGLDAPGQVSSVYDLAVFGRAALADRDLAAMVTTQRYPFPAAGTNFSNRRRQYEIQNHNRLLGAYAGATGIKNGYTRAAGGSYIASARRGDRSYVVALLKTDRQTWRMARTLLDWAFRSGPAARPVGVLGTAPVAEQLRSPATGTPGATPSPSAAASPPASTAPSPVPTVSAAPAPTAGGSGSPGTGGDARGSVVAGTATGTAAGAGAGTAGTSGPPALVWLLALTAAGALVGLAASRSRGSAPRRRS